MPALYVMQRDPESNRMAVTKPRDRQRHDAHWDEILADDRVVARAIVLGDALVGSVSCFQLDGLNSVGYWIAREYWGRGIASCALEMLLDEVSIRPLHARAARSNVGSIRVLERCGFTLTGYQQFPGDDRFPACEEAMYMLR